MFHRAPFAILGAIVLLFGSLPTVYGSFFETEMSRIRKDAADSYLTRVMSRPNMSTLPSGLLFSLERRGHGDVAPGPEDICEMHYHVRYRWPGTYENTREAPYPVHRSPSQLPLAGMQEAMQYMREGDRWEMVVPYSLAFGEKGLPDRKVPSWVNFRVDMDVYKCVSARGRTSQEIDGVLGPLLKGGVPAKTEEVRYNEL